MADVERTKAELLAIFADGQPVGSINPQGMRDYVVTADIVNTRFSTGLITGGIVTINTDAPANTRIDISAGTGFFADNHTDPLNPVRLKVSWSAFTQVTLPLLTSAPVTFIGLDLSSGTAVVQLQPAFFTAEEHRDFVVLAIAVHTSQVVIESISPFYNFAMDERQTLTDLATALFTINVKGGNVYSANSGGNLTIDKSVGETFSLGGNYQNSRKSPNNTIDAVLSPVTNIVYTYRDGSGGFVFAPPTNDIDPDQLDDGSGTLQTVSPNKFTTQRAWFLSGIGLTVIQYGQTEYSTLNDAVMDKDAEIFERNPQLDAGFRAWLFVKVGTTDLTDIALTRFIAASMFGDVLRP